jgi:hypothetical protein
MDRIEAEAKPSLPLFFAAVVALSIPFWVWGAVAEEHLIPGLPVSGLMAFCPAAAALLLTLWRQGRAEAARLLARCLDIHRLRERRLWLALNFALPPALLGLTYLLMRMGALNAALALGVFWALWHTIPYFETGRAAEWVAWHSLATVALRVVAVWLFVNTGRSIFAAACFHAMCNVAFFSFPNAGSHYDAAYFAPVIAAMAVFVALVWGPRTLTRN